MTFIVQDLLDYAQIKAGKFRKNITKFDLRECIEKVMCIQRQKAEEKSIDFNVRYINFGEDQSEGEIGDLFSYVLKTDEQRVMQVLLGLQSNALKFTSQGHVTIVAEIEIIRQ